MKSEILLFPNNSLSRMVPLILQICKNNKVLAILLIFIFTIPESKLLARHMEFGSAQNQMLEYQTTNLAEPQYAIRFRLDRIDCTKNIASYIIEIQSLRDESITLAGQNYRLFYDSSLAQFIGGKSLLGIDAYGEISFADDLVHLDFSNQGSLDYDSDMGFLNFGLSSNAKNEDATSEKQIQPAEIPVDGSWLPTIELFFQMEEGVIDSENQENCFSMDWAVPNETSEYISAYMIISEWLDDESSYYILDADYQKITADNACFSNGLECSEITLTDNVNELSKIAVNMDLGLWLEGAYRASSQEMTTELYDFGYLPGQIPTTTLADPTPAGQPYSGAPWFYNGSEGLSEGFEYPENTVDWILINLRAANNQNATICRKAALLLSDGSIQFVHGSDDCLVDKDKSYYVLAEHRNHLNVMSDASISVKNATISYDFRKQDSFKGFFSTFAQINMEGQWLMPAGNAAQNSLAERLNVQTGDTDLWRKENGSNSGYYLSDLDLNGDVNTQEKQLIRNNNGLFSEIEY